MQNKEDSDVESDDNNYGEIRQLLTLPDTHICDVWAYNFEEEMTKLMKMTEKFNVIAMVDLVRHRTQNSLVYMSIEMTFSVHAQKKKLNFF